MPTSEKQEAANLISKLKKYPKRTHFKRKLLTAKLKSYMNNERSERKRFIAKTNPFPHIGLYRPDNAVCARCAGVWGLKRRMLRIIRQKE